MKTLRLAIVLLTLLIVPAVTLACDCGAPGPACSYVAETKVIFLGTPVFTDDDGSGTFVQLTLYKFKVEEIFKGLAPETTEVWIDPGSFTSCYAEYAIGKMYLIFAGEAWSSMGSSSAMTVAPGEKGKPLPPDFAPGTPVYYAPECNGTRWGELAQTAIEWLRLWRDKKTSTRAYGTVSDDLGYPLAGVPVEIKSEHAVLKTVSSERGEWSFDNVTPGHYAASAVLDQYCLRWEPDAEIANGACGYFNLTLSTSVGIRGKVVNSKGQPMRRIRVETAKLNPDGTATVVIPWDETKRNGSFRINELTAGDFVIGVNLSGSSDVWTPYPRTYAPGVPDLAHAKTIHLAPNQQIRDVELRLPPAIPTRTIEVRVTWPDGRPAANALVEAYISRDTVAESALTNASGMAHLKCLSNQNYRVIAETRPQISPGTSWRLAPINMSEPKELSAGLASTRMEFVLVKERKLGDNR